MEQAKDSPLQHRSQDKKSRAPCLRVTRTLGPHTSLNRQAGPVQVNNWGGSGSKNLDPMGDPSRSRRGSNQSTGRTVTEVSQRLADWQKFSIGPRDVSMKN